MMLPGRANPLIAGLLIAVLLTACTPATAHPTGSTILPPSTEQADTPTPSNLGSADPLPGMPPVPDPRDIYAAAAAGMVSDVAKAARPLVYVPHTKSGEVWVIDPTTFAVIDRRRVGRELQHVVPSF